VHELLAETKSLTPASRMGNSDIIFVGGDRGLIEGVLIGFDVEWSHFWVLGQVLKS